MDIAQTDEPTRQPALRLWPGVVIVALQWLARFGVPVVVPGATGLGMLGGLLGGLAVLVWWAFFSRAPRSERWGAVAVMIGALVATPRILHESMAKGGMGTTFYFYAIPALSLALVVWAVAGRRLAAKPRRVAMVAAILLACGVWALLRTDGVTGDFAASFSWRWAPTPEQRLLAQDGDEPTALPSAADLITPDLLAADRVATNWPGFRGPRRDGVVPGVRIETDWTDSPPVELWRRRVGPGWSSFAVRGELLYTQEQRGDDEVVACYRLATGQPVWRHRDAARFWEPEGGAGPRATPTLSDGRLVAFGATGILNALDAGDGAVLWSRDAASDTGAEVPHYGFTTSPLVTGDLVIVAVAGQLVAYDLATSEPRWFGPPGGESYSSPHLMTIHTVAQILLLAGDGVTSVAPADGTLLWEHPWPSTKLVQPALTADGDVLIGTWFGDGTRSIAITHRPSEWTALERWTSRRLKPDFSDFVVHDGHLFGFDGRMLTCIDTRDGERKWKGGRYGHGQLLLLPDQDLVLVLSEQGDLALVAATPENFTELARLPAIEGKTWNHPALVGDLLLVRNGQEMAAFRLSLAGG